MADRWIPVRLLPASGSSTERSGGPVLLLSLRSRASPGDGAGRPRESAPPLGACKRPFLASFLLYSRIRSAIDPIPRPRILTDPPALFGTWLPRLRRESDC